MSFIDPYDGVKTVWVVDYYCPSVSEDHYSNLCTGFVGLADRYGVIHRFTEEYGGTKKPSSSLLVVGLTYEDFNPDLDE